jgi:hypothetical protein
MKACGGVDVQIHIVLTSAVAREVSGHLHAPAALLPGKESLVPIG